MNLNDKKLLLTGATGGIGQELTARLAAKGVHLLLNCVNRDALETLKNKLGNQHQVVAADISTVQGREEICRAAADFGVEGVINLAGILDFRWFEDQSPALIQKLMDVNLTGPMLLCRELLPYLHNHSDAVILNVGSTFGSIGHPGFVAYCASKAGMKHFSESLSRELNDTSVRVQYIAPRATATALNSDKVNAMNQELGNRSDTPGYVAEQIVLLLESESRHRFLGWPEKLFVKVNGLLPGIVHKALVGKLPVIKRYAKT